MDPDDYSMLEAILRHASRGQIDEPAYYEELGVLLITAASTI